MLQAAVPLILWAEHYKKKMPSAPAELDVDEMPLPLLLNTLRYAMLAAAY